MATRMLQRRGTAAAWAAQNPVLGAGEIGFETDTKIIKLGDGVNAWTDLQSSFLTTGGGSMSGIIDMQGYPILNMGTMFNDIDMGNYNLENVGDIRNPGRIGPMSDILDMNGRLIEDVGYPIKPDDAANKQFVEDHGIMQQIRFTSATDFVKANYPWLRYIRVRMVGGGGRGGNASTTGSGEASIGSGGGGAAYSESLFGVDELDSSEPIVVGLGGTTGSPGQINGGTSSFGTGNMIVAPGGEGGDTRPRSGAAYGMQGGSGGSFGYGDLRATGQGGGNAWGSGQLGMSGCGGSSVLGGGARGRVTSSSGQNLYGYDSGHWGGGGGGAINSAAVGSGAIGGDGGNGIVVIDLYA